MYDNNSYQGGLATAWGFSCLIQGTENTMLFDTGGDGSIVLANMQKLGIDPKEIERVVLSHMHWDHLGGVYHVLNTNHQVTLYLPMSFSAHFKDDVRRYGANVVDVREAVRICDQVYSSGELGSKIQEHALFIQTEKGLIVITGCAHPGIINIVQKAKEFLKDEVLLVMGGFHLGGENNAAIKHIVSDFRALGVRYVGPCHCSGDTARQEFEQEYRNNFIPVGVGRVINVKDLFYNKIISVRL
jgi:7,8-dihydropterin-6-yl-methyl-4-(beta-D-ribofuranosyl)aminobenzene 5'-phosphate synthase